MNAMQCLKSIERRAGVRGAVNPKLRYFGHVRLVILRCEVYGILVTTEKDNSKVSTDNLQEMNILDCSDLGNILFTSKVTRTGSLGAEYRNTTSIHQHLNLINGIFRL